MMEFNELLLKLAKNPEAHARFLNTLSMLEYIGARKILKSQHEKDISLEILSHVSEELRHARVFKKLAEEIGRCEFNGYSDPELLCGEEARDYFKSVDSEVHQRLADPRECYRITTLLVEERVMRLYPAYEELLATLGFAGRVRGILKEEERHLHEIEREQSRMETLSREILHELRQAEDRSFRNLLAGWMAA